MYEEIESGLTESQIEYLQKHAELFSRQQIESIDAFVSLHIKKKPSWLPQKIYNRLLDEIIVIDEFRKF